MATLLKDVFRRKKYVLSQLEAIGITTVEQAKERLHDVELTRGVGKMFITRLMEIKPTEPQQAPKYVAQFTTSQQYTPDDWKIITPSLEVTDQTTIGEIRKWMDEKHHGRYEREFKVIMLD